MFTHLFTFCDKMIRTDKKTVDRLKKINLGGKKNLALGTKLELLLDLYEGTYENNIFIADLNRVWAQLDEDLRMKYDTLRVALIKLKKRGELDINLLRIAAERSQKVE